MTIQIIRRASLGLPPGAIRTLDASTEAALIADKEAISVPAPNPPGDEEAVRYDPTTGNLIGARGQILSSVSEGGIYLDQSVSDDVAISAALAIAYANKGGRIVLPYRESGYTFSAPITVDVGQYYLGGGITVDLNGNVINYTGSGGFVFSFATNYFGANNGGKLGQKVVKLLGNGAAIYNLGGLLPAGGVQMVDTVRWEVSQLHIEGFQGGDAVQLWQSQADKSRWVEHGTAKDISGSRNLNGLHTKSEHVLGSFLGNVFQNLVFEAKTNGGKVFNLDGSFFDCVFFNCGGYYNQDGTTGGSGWYLNGGFRGTTIISPWIDVGDTGTQSPATDIVFGPNYTASLAYYPTLVNAREISLPINWRDKLFVADPISGGILSNSAAANPREILRSSRTYYVNVATGSDTDNDGLSAGAPFATVAKALTVIYQYIDAASQTLTIQLADGTYPPIVILGRPHGIGTASLVIKGNTATPSSVVIAATSADAISCKAGAEIKVAGLMVQTTTSGVGIKADESSRVLLDTGMEFGACASQHMLVTGGSTIKVLASYTITGNSPTHVRASLASRFIATTGTLTATGRAFSSQFVSVSENSVAAIQMTISAVGATGTRYYAVSGGLVQTYGGGATYLPGNAGGSADAAQFAQYL